MGQTENSNNNISISQLKTDKVEDFFPVFSSVLKTDFPGYSKAVIDYFLSKIYTPQAFRYWLTTGWKLVFIAKVDGKIAGFAVVDKPYGGVCFCRWLGVLADYQKKGIGKGLIKVWLEFAKTYGCHKGEIASQPTAKDFYLKCGLELEGERKLSYFGIDQFIFGKVLGQPQDKVMIKD
jgi:GNAT superfamily N-acetyltransferase